MDLARDAKEAGHYIKPEERYRIAMALQ